MTTEIALKEALKVFPWIPVELPPESGFVWALMDASGRAAAMVSADGTLTLSKFAAKSVPGAALKDQSVGSSQLAAGAVGVAQLDATVQGLFPVALPAESGFVWALIDSANRVAARVAVDGTVSFGKVALPDGAVTYPQLSAAVQALIPGSLSPESGFVFAIVDGLNRLGFGVTTDGKIVGSLANAIVANLDSGPSIVCFGDSLTAGAGATGGLTYPAQLAALTGRTVTNRGVGGETSLTITGRQGARPMLATVSGGVIPASGGVTITLAGDNGTVAPLLQGDGGLNPVSILGVPGTISYASSTYTFTRTSSGSTVAAAFPAAVIPANWSAGYRDAINIVWMGQNDPIGITTAVINRHLAIQTSLTRPNKRWLVLGLTSGTASSRASEEAACLEAFGRRYVNLRAYLSSYAALAAAGITPTSADDTAIANGQTPPSFLSDAVHHNNLGYGRVAFLCHQRMTELGWL